MSRILIPDPGTMLMTPLGMPALTVNSANFSAVSGVTWKNHENLSLVPVVCVVWTINKSYFVYCFCILYFYIYHSVVI